MSIRWFFFAVPIAFAVAQIVYFICEIRKAKKTETCDTKPAETVKTVQDYHDTRDKLSYP